MVPFRQMAPTSRFEKPATRVYSSPKPTQPDSSTIGEAKRMPQKSSASDAGGGVQAAAAAAGLAGGESMAAFMFKLSLKMRPDAAACGPKAGQPEDLPRSMKCSISCSTSPRFRPTRAIPSGSAPTPVRICIWSASWGSISSTPQLKRAGLDYHDLARVSPACGSGQLPCSNRPDAAVRDRDRRGQGLSRGALPARRQPAVRSGDQRPAGARSRPHCLPTTSGCGFPCSRRIAA